MPWRGTSIQASLDVFSSELIVERSNGETRRVALLPVRTVAEIYAELQYALSALAVGCTISPIYQDLPDATPLHEDHRPEAYEPHVVQRWFYAATAAASFFDRWRAHFFGRTGIQIWWGALGTFTSHPKLVNGTRNFAMSFRKGFASLTMLVRLSS